MMEDGPNTHPARIKVGSETRGIAARPFRSQKRIEKTRGVVQRAAGQQQNGSGNQNTNVGVHMDRPNATLYDAERLRNGESRGGVLAGKGGPLRMCVFRPCGPSRGRFAYGVTSNTVPAPLAPPMGVVP